MGVITKGHTFTSGENVTADKLNNLADDATFNSNTTDDTTLEVHSTGYLKVKNAGIDTTQLANGAVTYTKIQNVAANSVIGNPTSSDATPQAISIADLSTDVVAAINNSTPHTSDTDSDGTNDTGGSDGLMSAEDKTKLDGLTNTTYSAGTGLNLTGTTFALDDKLQISSSEVVVNEGGTDVDFRVEGDTNNNLLVCDAGNDRVVIGGTTPTEDSVFSVLGNGSAVVASIENADTGSPGGISALVVKGPRPVIQYEDTAGTNNSTFNFGVDDNVFYFDDITGTTTTFFGIRILGLRKVGSSGVLNIANIPTSSAGLSSGDVWRNGSVLNIVP